MRQRAFGGVDEQHDAVDHFEGALDFAAEIGVAGGVDDVDLLAVVEDGGVFGEDGDAALALELVGIHDALGDGFIGAEGAGLAEKGVDEGGLAVVDVGDDGDIANGAQEIFPNVVVMARPPNADLLREEARRDYRLSGSPRASSMEAKSAARSRRRPVAASAKKVVSIQLPEEKLNPRRVAGQ